MRAALADVAFHDPAVAAARQRRRPPDRRPPRRCRTELVEHLTAGVDWVRAVERMAAAGVTTFVEVGPGKRPDRPHQAHRPRRRGHRRRRPGVARPTPRPRRRPRLTDHPTGGRHLAQARLRPPRRRHRTRRHQLRRQRRRRPPGPTSSTACPASARSPGSTPTPYEAKLGRRGPRLRRRPTGWTPRPPAAASRACISASPPRSRRSPIPASR